MLPEEVYLRIRAQMFAEVLRWRRYLRYLVEAVRRVFGSEVRVYVFGSAVEGKLTADSDIDVAVVLREVPRSGLERARLVDQVFRYMEQYGVPWWYPFEIHLLTEEELEVLKRGGAKLVPAEELLEASPDPPPQL